MDTRSKKKKTKSQDLIDELKQLTREFAASIDPDMAEKLNDDVGNFFEEHCNESGMLNYVHMAFALANGLSFALSIMTDYTPCKKDCATCEHAIDHKKVTIQ